MIACETDRIIFESFCGGYDKNFIYLLTDKATHQQYLVDAALPLRSIQQSIQPQYMGLLLTHTHEDHTAFVGELVNVYPKIIIHANEPSVLSKCNVRPISDGDRIPFGDRFIHVIHTPGHTIDSCCFYLEPYLFTGDTLFVGRTGRTISPGSNTVQLYRSVYSKLLPLPPETLIFPGHDYGEKPMITLSQNIEMSPLLQATDESDFCKRMAFYEANR